MKYILLLLCLLCQIKAHSQVPYYVPTDSLIGFWTFNGSAEDQFDNFLGGTVHGATLTTDRFGIPNSAYHFGINKYIEVPYSPLLKPGDGLSISCFLQVDTFPGMWQDIVSNWRDQPGGINKRAWNFTITYNHQLEGVVSYNGYTNQQGVYYTPPFALGAWYHAVFTYDGVQLKLYLNNVLVQTAVGNGNIFGLSESLIRFGAKNNYNGIIECFRGKIDDIGIWNRALTSCEVAQLYSGNAAQIVTSQGDNVICQGDSIILYGNTGAFTYQWYNNGVPILNATEATYSATESGNYKLILSDSICATESTTMPISVVPFLPAPVIYGGTVICQNETTELTASYGDHVFWSTGDTAESVFIGTPGLYNVYVASGNCISDTAFVNVITNPFPSAAVVQDQNTLTAVTGGASYEWVDCNDNFQPVGQTQQSFSPLVDGNYAVIVTEDGCTNVSSCYGVGGVAVPGVKEDAFWNVAPNPFSESAWLMLTGDSRGYDVQVDNALGETLSRQHVRNLPMDLGLDALASGIYLVKLTSARSHRTRILVKR